MASPTGAPDNSNGSNNNNRNNTNNNGNNNTLDAFMGTNVYLYGFLSTLILIFLVSVAVAYKGYRTRALLRQRIDEALAAGVFIPGVSSDGSPAGRRHRDAAEKPVLSEVWLRRRQAANVSKWDQLQVRPTPNFTRSSVVADLWIIILMWWLAPQSPTCPSNLDHQRTTHTANAGRMGGTTPISTWSSLTHLPQPPASSHSLSSIPTTSTVQRQPPQDGGW